MPFSDSIAREVLVRSRRCCCICHQFCGTKIELHHIVPVEQGGDDSFENCIPVCFNCHAEIGHYNEKHPRGRRLAPQELRQHRDKWLAQQEAASRKKVVEGTLTADGAATSTTFALDGLTADSQISLHPLTPEAAALLGKCWIGKEDLVPGTSSSEPQAGRFTVKHPALHSDVVASFRFLVSD